MAYQEIAGARVPVESRYVLSERKRRRRIRVRRRAATTRTTSWSSTPAWSTRPSSAGRATKSATGIAVDAAGNAYVAGTDPVAELPDDRRRVRRTGAAGNFADVFVTKLNAAGTALVYSTFLGGSNFEFGRAHRDRRGRQRLRHGPDEVVELPDDRRRVRPHLQRRQLPALRHRSIRRLRHQAERRRLGARLLDLPRRHRHRRRARHRGRRLGQRLRRPARRVSATSRRPPAPSTRTRNGALRRLRHQAERRRLGAGLLDLPRRHRRSTTASRSRSTGRATRT